MLDNCPKSEVKLESIFSVRQNFDKHPNEAKMSLVDSM